MLIRVKVFPHSKKKIVIKKSINHFEVKVKEEAQNGMANKATIELLADYFKIPSKNIRIVRGFKKRSKTLELIGVSSN